MDPSSDTAPMKTAWQVAVGNTQEVVQKQQKGIPANRSLKIYFVMCGLALMTSCSSFVFNVFSSVCQFPVTTVT